MADINDAAVEVKLNELGDKVKEFGSLIGMVGHMSYVVVLLDEFNKVALTAHAHGDDGPATLLALGLEAELFGEITGLEGQSHDE